MGGQGTSALNNQPLAHEESKVRSKVRSKVEYQYRGMQCQNYQQFSAWTSTSLME